ncbi:MAG: D-2-hydroxyacid dehydrogenase [Syntrophorhabdaceae bacterium]|nr:D-2-hydroxyacid dehydrogenase [Syntrophorhabdaceae bacterium]
MYILLAMPDALDYRKDLERIFPDITFHHVTTEEGILEHAKNVDILITIFRVSDHILKECERLKWIQVITSGVNYLLGRPSLKKETIITTCRGIHGPQMSEMAILLMLALNRNFPKMVKNQEKRVWERWDSRLLKDKKVGILGVGVIGREIARKCKAFDMTVYGIDIVKTDVEWVDLFFGPEDLKKVAGEVDYLILCAPSTPETIKIINRDILNAMKKDAFLINIARGEMVDDIALLEALNGETIAGAALDALPIEPLPEDHPLWGAKNIIITPHVGGVSDIYRHQVMPIITENLKRFLNGERRELINFTEH